MPEKSSWREYASSDSGKLEYAMQEIADLKRQLEVMELRARSAEGLHQMFADSARKWEIMARGLTEQRDDETLRANEIEARVKELEAELTTAYESLGRDDRRSRDAEALLSELIKAAEPCLNWPALDYDATSYRVIPAELFNALASAVQKAQEGR